MVDTIHIELDTESDLPTGSFDMPRLLNVIDISSEVTKRPSGLQCYIGKFRNFNITIVGNTIDINGSLTKYYKNNNLDFLSKEDISNALKMLSWELGINVERGRLRRIDVADNFFLSAPPQKYIHAFIELPKARPGHPHRTGKYFHRSNTTAYVYDKAEELKRKDEPTYHRLMNAHSAANLLRFEVRYQSQLPALFKIKSVKVALLHSSSFLKKLADGWLKHYNLILKAHLVECDAIKNPGLFKRLLMCKGIFAFDSQSLVNNLNVIDSLINDLHDINQWEYHVTYRLKTFVRRLLSDPTLTIESPLIRELDDAIENSNIVKSFVNN